MLMYGTALIRAEDFDKDLNDNSSLGVDGIENLAGECAILLEYLWHPRAICVGRRCARRRLR